MLKRQEHWLARITLGLTSTYSRCSMYQGGCWWQQGKKSKLHKLEKDGIVEKVTEPTPWISSMVNVVKPNGKLRICLDQKDLNRAVLREKYQLPTIKDVATRLNDAKVFTKLDARNGFWHIQMDKESSRLTTFHTPSNDIAGGGSHSAVAQRLRFSRAGCTRSLKVLLELR